MIKLVETRPTRYRGHDGSLWGSREGASSDNVLGAAKRGIDPVVWDSYGYPYMMFHNLARHATATDLMILAQIVDHYIGVERPQIMALDPKSVGHQKDGRIIYIETEDGEQHISRHWALEHLLRKQMEQAFSFGILTKWARASIYQHGINPFTDVEKQIPNKLNAGYTFLSLFRPKLDEYDGDLDKYAADPKDMAVMLRDTFFAMAETKKEPIPTVTAG